MTSLCRFSAYTQKDKRHTSNRFGALIFAVVLQFYYIFYATVFHNLDVFFALLPSFWSRFVLRNSAKTHIPVSCPILKRRRGCQVTSANAWSAPGVTWSVVRCRLRLRLRMRGITHMFTRPPASTGAWGLRSLWGPGYLITGHCNATGTMLSWSMYNYWHSLTIFNYHHLEEKVSILFVLSDSPLSTSTISVNMNFRFDDIFNHASRNAVLKSARGCVFSMLRVFVPIWAAAGLQGRCMLQCWWHLVMDDTCPRGAGETRDTCTDTDNE